MRLCTASTTLCGMRRKGQEKGGQNSRNTGYKNIYSHYSAQVIQSYLTSKFICYCFFHYMENMANVVYYCVTFYYCINAVMFVQHQPGSILGPSTCEAKPTGGKPRQSATPVRSLLQQYLSRPLNPPSNMI